MVLNPMPDESQFLGVMLCHSMEFTNCDESEQSYPVYVSSFSPRQVDISYSNWDA